MSRPYRNGVKALHHRERGRTKDRLAQSGAIETRNPIHILLERNCFICCFAHFCFHHVLLVCFVFVCLLPFYLLADVSLFCACSYSLMNDGRLDGG